MFAGYVSEPMPGEKRERREAKEQNIVGDNFSEADFPAFSPDGQSDESATETITNQTAESGESNNIYNPNGEANRRPETVTESTARGHAENGNNLDIKDLVQDVAGSTPGGREAILQDNEAARTNAAIAKSAADSLGSSITPGRDGRAEGENILVSAMTAAAGAEVATEQAGIDSLYNPTNAEASISDAQEAIRNAEELKRSLSEAASVVQDRDTVMKMETGAQEIEAQLSSAQDTLAAAVEAKTAAEQNSSNENTVEGSLNNNESEPTLEEVSNQPKAKIIDLNPETAANFAPGQVNADTIKSFQEELNGEQKAA